MLCVAVHGETKIIPHSIFEFTAILYSYTSVDNFDPACRDFPNQQTTIVISSSRQNQGCVHSTSLGDMFQSRQCIRDINSKIAPSMTSIRRLGSSETRNIVACFLSSGKTDLPLTHPTSINISPRTRNGHHHNGFSVMAAIPPSKRPILLRISLF